ncbi:MAG: hypothetical protein SFW09_18825 [Hyphomicrobiaceae bacterium]|nr:hypothetical protein [Hyphomicrobiaceae bacterium]
MTFNGTRRDGAAKRAKTVEQIALTLQSTGLRKVAFTAVETDPVTTSLAKDVAEVAARSGRRTLVLDLAGSSTAPGWLPGDDMVEPAPDATGRKFDSLRAPAGAAARAAYNNPERVGDALDGLLASYDLVILCTAGLIDDRDDRVNAVAAGAATDGIILVCPTGLVTVTKLQRAMQLVAAAGGKVVGTVLDDRANPLLVDELSDVVQRTLAFVPPVGRWLAERVRRSEFLRTPIHP